MDKEKIAKYLNLADWTTQASEAETKFYQQRRSPRLSSPSMELLDPQTEINWYLNNFSIDYRTKLNELDNQINVGKMSSDCRLSFVVPVADHQEEKYAYRLLSTYLGQEDKNGGKIDPNQFEVLLLLNHQEGETPDKTKNEIARFKMTNSDLNVRVVEAVFPKKTPMGRILKTLCDLSIIRSQKRDNSTNSDLIIARNDADMAGLSKTYVINTISFFDNYRNRHVGVVRGKVRRSEDWAKVKAQFPVSYTAYTYRELIRRANRLHGIYTEIQGANLIIRSGIYASIGGFNEFTAIGEDSEIAKMIKLARFGKIVGIPDEKSTIGYLASSWVDTDPRRVQYCATHHTLIADRFKTYREDVAFESDSSDTQSTLDVDHLEQEINALNESFGITPDSPEIATVLRLMGIGYEIHDEKIRVIYWK